MNSPTNLPKQVFTCDRVLNRRRPILSIWRHEGDDYSLLCGADHEVDLDDLCRLAELRDLPGATSQVLDVMRQIDAHGCAFRESERHGWTVVKADTDGQACEPLIEQADAIAKQVRQFGWSVATIHEGDAALRAPFAYSIGMSGSFGAPEISITGLPGAIAVRIINMLGERARKGDALVAEMIIDGLLEGDYKCMLKKVSAQGRQKFGLALAHYGNLDFDALQCVWPDRMGKFPWEEGYSLKKFDQPFLFEDDK
jgi:hypothetical protein